MSMSKRLLFGKNPADDGERERLRKGTSEYVTAFVFRIPTRKRNPQKGSYWDPVWPSSLSMAARELGIETIRLNDGIMTRTKADHEALLAHAQLINAQRSKPAGRP